MTIVGKYLRKHVEDRREPQPTRLPSAIELTKVQGAFNQTMMAVEMLLRGRYECAITLAGAAEGMVPPTPLSVHRMRMEMQLPEDLKDSFYADLDKKQKVNFWNKQIYWLKHHDPAHKDKEQLSRFDAASVIVRALSHLPDEWLRSTPLAPEHEAMLQEFFDIWIVDTAWVPPVEP